ncbi:MAG: ATP-dependent Clp protease ATP-binding subunit, partial [Chloroflexi bacterium]|nr:ATP-dependent Clp protease ATP-binding subunit [Chloroflexota bacterium]
NTVLLMTSNLGTEFVQRSGSLGCLHREGEGEDKENQEKIEKSLKATFRPEFLNRIDDIIIFSPLKLEAAERIVDLQLRELRERLKENNVSIELTDAARKWLAKQGYDKMFGARPLRRALQKYIESPLSVQMLRGDFVSGDTVLVDMKEEQIEFRKGGAGIPVEMQKATA